MSLTNSINYIYIDSSAKHNLPTYKKRRTRDAAAWK